MNYDDDESLDEKETQRKKLKTGGAQIKDDRPSKSASARSISTQSPSGYKSSYMKPKMDFRDSKFENTLFPWELPRNKSTDGKQYAEQNGNKDNLILKKEPTDDIFKDNCNERPQPIEPNRSYSSKIKREKEFSPEKSYVFTSVSQNKREKEFSTEKSYLLTSVPQNKRENLFSPEKSYLLTSVSQNKTEKEFSPEKSYLLTCVPQNKREKEFSHEKSYHFSSVHQNQSPEQVNSFRPYSERKVKIHFLTVMIMNASGPSGDKGPEPAPRQKQTIYDVLNKFSPDIVLFQEFTWKKIHGAHWGNFSLPKRYIKIGHDHAALLIDIRQFEKKGFPSGRVDSLLERTLKNMKKYKLPIDQNEFTPRARMEIERFEKKGKSSSQEIIVISWHGRSNQHGRGGGLSINFKVYLFRYLFEFLCQIKEEFKLPIIIGGDFNIEKGYIEQYVTEPFKLISYTPSDRRSKGGTKDVIDYFIATDDLVVSAKYIDLEKVSTANNPNQVLDHDPIIANVDLNF